MRRRFWTAAVLAVAMTGCSHSTAYDNAVPTVGPSGPGPDVQLTYNANQDYWPTWTADGRGILYSFAAVGVTPDHRCVRLLPAGGGAGIWQLCDDRATQTDSVSSFPAYALGEDGRLLYVEATSPAGAGASAPAHVTLFLADTAEPFRRQALLALPTFASGTPVAWLADIAWTGPSTFIALAQDFSGASHCRGCIAIDTIFPGEAVVRGTIVPGTATLTAIPGTAGATGYSVAENGASVVFTLADDRRLYKVPIAGGTPVAVAIVSPNSTAQLLGVSCRGSTCVVAADPVSIGASPPSIGPGPKELRGVSLATGMVQVLRSTVDVVATPQISPLTGDVVAQVGGAFGHLQTTTSSGSDLFLYLGLIR